MRFRSVTTASGFAAFLAHIAQVIGLRSLPEMIVSDTSADSEIAGMAHVQRVVYFAARQKECNAMGNVKQGLDIERAATISIFRAFPNPAVSIRAVSRRLINVLMEIGDLLRGELRNVTIGLSHRFEINPFKFVVRADRCGNICSARFAL